MSTDRCAIAPTGTVAGNLKRQIEALGYRVRLATNRDAYFNITGWSATAYDREREEAFTFRASTLEGALRGLLAGVTNGEEG